MPINKILYNVMIVFVGLLLAYFLLLFHYDQAFRNYLFSFVPGGKSILADVCDGCIGEINYSYDDNILGLKYDELYDGAEIVVKIMYNEENVVLDMDSFVMYENIQSVMKGIGYLEIHAKLSSKKGKLLDLSFDRKWEKQIVLTEAYVIQGEDKYKLFIKSL